MPIDNFGSPGVTTKEIDQSFVTPQLPQGVPAGVIGTAKRGPAFVPITVGSQNEFINKFGEIDGAEFGPLAVAEWLRSAQSACFVRVLGAGDGNTRTSSGNNAGKVTNAGFVVGSEQVQANGTVGRSTYGVANGVLGRVHFLGCLMSASAGSPFFSEAGLNAFYEDAGTKGCARPIIRGVIMAASGVTLMLSGNEGASGDNAAPYSANGAATVLGPKGGSTGSVNRATGEFTLYVNGLHDNSTDKKSVIEASFNVNSSSYFARVFNRDPRLIEEKGHVLYTFYDVQPEFAVITGSGIVSESWYNPHDGDNLQWPYAFLLTSSLARNSGSTTIPSFENFEDRFQYAQSPWVISQNFGGAPTNLFKVHALDAGAWINDKIKVSISNLKRSQDSTYEFGSFTLEVREFDDHDLDKRVLERFSNLNLDPNSENYVAARIGDMNTYYDFDVAAKSQRLVISGRYPNLSNYIRVEMDPDVDDNVINDVALPVGFRGPKHLVTSGSSITLLQGAHQLISGSVSGGGTKPAEGARGHARYNWLLEPPIPFRRKISKGTDTNERVEANYYWGVMFERKDNPTQENGRTELNDSIKSYTKYFPSFHTDWRNPWVGDNAGVADSGGTILDSDRFNNNKFTLENVRVVTGSTTYADPAEADAYVYTRQGGIAADDSAKTRAFTVADLDDPRVRSLMKYTFFLQGGFDGVNIFDREKTKLSNTAAVREMGEAAQGQRSGPTVAAYLKALDVIGSTADVDIQVLALPGVRESTISDYAISTVEDRFDAIYVMDVEEFDTNGTELTSSAQLADVGQTKTQFNSRALDSSFAAAYFPDVNLTFGGKSHRVPPSVAVLGSYAFTDATEYPWRAPAGMKRGELRNATSVAVELSQTNMDDLYDVDINPIVAFPGSNKVTIWGQKTLLAAQSSLDRVNVRRLLIELRRQVRGIARRLVFEPNRASTLAKFDALVRPKLDTIKRNLGVERYKVQIDTTTTTQADVENNTIRGKIWIQPTKAAEFISLDFVVSNTIEE